MLTRNRAVDSTRHCR